MIYLLFLYRCKFNNKKYILNELLKEFHFVILFRDRRNIGEMNIYYTYLKYDLYYILIHICMFYKIICTSYLLKLTVI